MVKLCGCQGGVNDEALNRAVRDAAELIQSKPTFGQAVNVPFHATHDMSQPHCGNCTPHFARAIVNAGLRPPEELDAWLAKRDKALSHNDGRKAKCNGCTNAGTGACKNIPQF